MSPANGRRKLARAAVVLTVGCLLALFWQARHTPPLNIDALVYHLTIPALWIQRGFLAPIDLPFHDAAAEHSPMFAQIITWCLMRFTGDDGLVWIVQPVAFLLVLPLFFRTARLAGAGRAPALLLTAGLALWPPLVRSAGLCNNELVEMLGAAWLLYGLALAGRRPAAGVIHGGAGIALMLATKTVGVVYAAVGLALLVIPAWRLGTRQRKKIPNGINPPTPARKGALRSPSGPPLPGGDDGSRSPPPEGCRGGFWNHPAIPVIGALALVAIGGFFFWRNWWIYGDPIYPATIHVGHTILFPGLYDTGVLVNHGFRWAALAGLFVQSGDLFGPTLPMSALLLLGPVLLVALGILRRRSARPGAMAAGAVFPAAAALLYLLVVPFWQQHRLLFPVYYGLWVGLAAGLAGLARWNRRRGGRIAVGVAGLVVLWHVATATLWAAIESFALLLGVAILAGLVPWPRRMMRRVVWPAAFGIAAIAALTFSTWYPSYRAARADREAWYIDRYGAQGRAWGEATREARRLRRTRSRPVVIALAGSSQIYPLLGSDFANRVVYVPVGPSDRPTPVTLRPGESVYLRLIAARRARPVERFWIDRLRADRVDLLVLVDQPLTGGVAVERGFVSRHPEMFEEIFSGTDASGSTVVYRVRPTPRPSRDGSTFAESAGRAGQYFHHDRGRL